MVLPVMTTIAAKPAAGRAERKDRAMSESASEKASRYLVEGRLLVGRADERTIAATCRGNGAIYRLGYDGRGWYCSCPARSRCAHLLALMLVVIAPDGAGP
jgi:hypothetical protein